MTLDISTLAVVSGLIFFTEAIALAVQYSVNRAERGVRWWLAGTALWAVGLLVMLLVKAPALLALAALGNPLVILAFIFLNVGLNRFLRTTAPRGWLLTIFGLFCLLYNYFVYIDWNLWARSLIVMATMGGLALLTAGQLFRRQDRRLAGSANFTALVFTAYGLFALGRVAVLLFSPPSQTYAEQGPALAIAFIVPTLTSLLWTFGFIIMVNQRLNTENREEKEKLQLIFNTSPDAAIISRLDDGLIVDINAGFITMSGHERADLVGTTTLALKLWHQAADRAQFVATLHARGVCENQEFTFQRKDGSLFPGRISARILSIQAVPHVVSVLQDLSASKQAEAALHESEALYRSILNASPDIIAITDLAGRVLVVSPAAKRIFGYPPDYDQLVGTPLLSYIVPEDRTRAAANITQMLSGDYHAGPHEYRGIRQDGSLFEIEVNSGQIRDADQRPSKMVFVVRDITGRKQADLRIQQLVRQLETEKRAAQRSANTDSLTGLPNRRNFDTVLHQEFGRLQRSGLPLSLIMLDVDHFKKYNDRYGHLAGDECLRHIGTVLQAFGGRATDTVARYGGEEFVVLLAETEQAGAVTLAERLRAAVEALAIPHADSAPANCVTVSLGVVTVYPSQIDTPERALALADQALYYAKRAGRNRSVVTTADAALEQAYPY